MWRRECAEDATGGQNKCRGKREKKLKKRSCVSKKSNSRLSCASVSYAEVARSAIKPNNVKTAELLLFNWLAGPATTDALAFVWQPRLTRPTCGTDVFTSIKDSQLQKSKNCCC